MKKSILVKAIFTFVIINLILISIVSLLGGRIVTLSLKSNSASEIQFFYITKENSNFSELNSTKTIYDPSSGQSKVRSLIFTKDIDKFRIDFGNSPSKYEVEYLSISDGLFSKKVWNNDEFIKDFKNNQQIQLYSTNNDNIKLDVLGSDGFVSGDRISGDTKINVKMILLEITLCLILIILIIRRDLEKYCLRILNYEYINKLTILNNKYVKKIKILFNKHINGMKLEFSSFKQYISSNKYIMYVTIFFTILAHGVALFYYKIGIDNELTIVGSLNEETFTKMGRFGVNLIKKIFSTDKITIPAYNLFLAFTMLSLFAILSTYVMNKYSKRKSKLANASFLIIFITFSQIPTYTTFVVYSFEVSMGYFIVSLSVLFLTRAILDKSNILDFILGVALLMFTISIYQCFITLYISFICTIFLVKNNNYNRKLFMEEIIKLVKFIIALVIAIIIYFCINFILTKSLINVDGYLGNFVGWRNNNASIVILTIISSIKSVIFGYGMDMLKISYIILSIILVIILLIGKNKINALYLTGFMVSPFLLNIVLGSAQPIRSLASLSFFVGMFSYMLIAMIKNKNIQKIMFVGIFIVGLYQAQSTCKLYFGDFMRYNQDVELGNTIAQKIEELNLGEKPKYPVVYIGLHSPQDQRLIIRDEALGYSFFEWDGGRISRIKSFMDIIGHNYIYPSQEDIQNSYESSKNMPIWPQSESVKVDKNVIIVKLSEPTDYWKYTNSVK